MAQFQVNILGCGSAVPTPWHNPSCQVVDYRDTLMMIDCGEGAQAMMRKMQLKFSRLRYVFISHLHGDHCFGLPGLLSTMGLLDCDGKLTVFMPAEGLELMHSFVGFFCHESPLEIDFKPIAGNGGRLLDLPGLTVDAFPLYHHVPCYGFLFREKEKPRHLLGDMAKFYNIPHWRLDEIRNGADFVTPQGETIPNDRLTTDPTPSGSYAYCSDTVFDPRVADAVKGVQTIYHEATYLDNFAQKAHDRGHSTAAEAGRIAAMAGAERLVVGHYSKRYSDTSEHEVEAKREFGGEVVAATEGLRINLV